MTTEKQPKPTTRQTDARKLPRAQTRGAFALPNFDDLPNSAFARQDQLVRNPRNPTRPTPLPFSPATFWRKVKEGNFPQPIKLGKRITAWKVGDVRAWMEACTEDQASIVESPLRGAV